MTNGEHMRPVNEASVADWLSFGRWITGIRSEMREACFQHRSPANRAAYEPFFGCPVRFGADDNALSFDIGLLATPLVQHDEQLYRLMEQQAQEQLRQIHGAQLTPRVVAAIRRQLPQQTPTAAQIARTLELSERSLRRRVAERAERARPHLHAHVQADQFIEIGRAHV